MHMSQVQTLMFTATWPAEVRALALACWLNEAQCALTRDEPAVAVRICDSAIRTMADPLGTDADMHVKALYRRAEARIRPSKSTAYDLDMAIKDLSKAKEADPKNQMVNKLLIGNRILTILGHFI